MSTLTVTKALANWFGKPITKLPRELRPIAEAYISQWSSLSPDERRARADEIDRQRVVKGCMRLTRSRRELERDQNDPLIIAEGTIGWWDGEATMSASFWWDQPSVTPYQAALILCQYNPNKLKGVDPEKDSTGETGPVDYAQLRFAFDAIERGTPANRPLSDWLTYAKRTGLKYHTWIDEYVTAINTLGALQRAETATSPELAEPPKPSAAPAASTGESLPKSPTTEISEASPTRLGGKNWALQTPERYQGYRRPLYLVLKAAYDAGSARPNARDVLDAFKLKLPPEVIEVMSDGLKYYDTHGDSKVASLRDISKTITRLVV